MFNKGEFMTLYVTDLDGTLLNSNEKLSEYTIKVINGLIKKGMNFSYATARSIVSASLVTQGLNLNVPVITFNGTFMVNSYTKERIEALYFNKYEIEYIKNTLIKYSINPLVYSDISGDEKVSWIESKENQGIKNYKFRRNNDKRLRPVETIEEVFQGNIFYFMCIGSKEDLEKLYNNLIGMEDLTCTFQKEIYNDDYLCEIYTKEANKGNSVKRLKEKLNCNKIITFGDAVNDIPMFKISDECYAVENAAEELKNCASGIIGSNEADGVARWLEQNHI